jgi:hypothetical protein
MINGSFDGLYTFSQVGEIYGFDASSLRKQVACEKLIEGRDIKKFGKTWVITEQSMVKNFGILKFEDYKKKKIKEEEAEHRKLNAKKIKVKSSRTSKKSDSMNQKDEKINNSWVNGDIKGVEVKSFAFNTNDNK